MNLPLMSIVNFGFISHMIINKIKDVCNLVKYSKGLNPRRYHKSDSNIAKNTLNTMNFISYPPNTVWMKLNKFDNIRN
jgi:hypothetical protein